MGRGANRILGGRFQAVDDRVETGAEAGLPRRREDARPVPSTLLGQIAEARHLVLLGLVFLAAIAAFLLVRRAVVPEGFGEYGHYRPGALNDNRMHPLAFAGRAECATCHPNVVSAKSAGKHRPVSCEACHGPLARHATDPDAVRPLKIASVTLCVRCHERDSAKPMQFPQVASAGHSGGEACVSCHQPHSPGL